MRFGEIIDGFLLDLSILFIYCRMFSYEGHHRFGLNPWDRPRKPPENSALAPLFRGGCMKILVFRGASLVPNVPTSTFQNNLCWWNMMRLDPTIPFEIQKPDIAGSCSHDQHGFRHTSFLPSTLVFTVYPWVEIWPLPTLVDSQSSHWISRWVGQEQEGLEQLHSDFVDFFVFLLCLLVCVSCVCFLCICCNCCIVYDHFSCFIYYVSLFVCFFSSNIVQLQYIHVFLFIYFMFFACGFVYLVCWFLSWFRLRLCLTVT